MKHQNHKHALSSLFPPLILSVSLSSLFSELTSSPSFAASMAAPLKLLHSEAHFHEQIQGVIEPT
ncbi:hypothetical protein BVRB_7g160310 [Beta vulgaris subsp. vulgaris]|nr:hypothetical protein BVRB_7g160310 [Beta vulgaris subsp. vulgaris]